MRTRSGEGNERRGGMSSWLRRGLLALTLAGGLCAAGQARAGETPAKCVVDFETATAVPEGWTTEGDVTLAKAGALNSKHSLLFQRTSEKVNDPTTALSAPFAVKGGMWEVKAFCLTNFYSPDSSFNGTIKLQLLDKSGKPTQALEIAVVDKSPVWNEFVKTVRIPADTTSARFAVTLNKTYGKFQVDNLVASYTGPAVESLFSAVKIAPRAYGSFFQPGEKVVFDLTVECSGDWKEPQAAVQVTDYWGAEMAPVINLPLQAAGEAGTLKLYKAELDLSGINPAPGKYHEVRVAVANGEKDVYRELNTFAILPIAVTKKYRPHEIPFTLNNWDDRIKDTFFLADRMGIRWKLVWSGWETTPPYEPYAPGIEWIKELDMGALMGMRPVSNIEGQREGYEKITEECLREGAKNLINKYKDYVPMMVRCGNEPHSGEEWVKKDIPAYKAVYEGVKAADPSVFFIGSSCGTEEEFFKQGYMKYLDAVDFHTYEGWQELRKTFATYKERFAKYNNGEAKPIFTTEIGLNCQGMSLQTVSQVLVKKFATFFAEGGANLAWFDLMYPDTKGTIEGSNADAFNVFRAKYCLYAPKLTGVAYYNMVNGICIKKFVQEARYPDDRYAVLFRDKDNACLVVLWQEKGRQDLFLPLPGVKEVKQIRLDGGISMLDAGGKGLTLTASEDPQLLFFQSADYKLPAETAAPEVTLVGALPEAIKGSKVSLAFRTAGVDAKDLSLVTPPGWTVEPAQSAEAGTAAFTVTAPDRTGARVGMLMLQEKSGRAQLTMALPVAGKLAAYVQPAPYAGGKAGVRALIRNNSDAAEKVTYTVAVPDEIAMARGTFDKNAAQPFAAAFATTAEDTLVIPAHSEKEIVVPVENFNAKNIYRAVLTVKDAQGEKVESRRFISGMVGVPRVPAALSMDLAKDEEQWKRAPVQLLNEQRQYYPVAGDRAEKWDNPDDLSGELRFLWDENYLYLRMDVTDDKYAHGKADGSLWAMDGLQLLVDPSRNSTEKGGYYDIAIGDGSKGPQCFYHSSAVSSVRTGLAKEVIVKAFPGGKGEGGRIYVAAIPWSRLAPFQPVAGGNIGLAVIINEDDGAGRTAFLGWFGCAHSKQLDLVGDLILQK